MRDISPSSAHLDAASGGYFGAPCSHILLLWALSYFDISRRRLRTEPLYIQKQERKRKFMDLDQLVNARQWRRSVLRKFGTLAGDGLVLGGIDGSPFDQPS